MLNKKIILIITFVIPFVACVSKPTASTDNGIDLDTVIKEAAQQMETRIPSGTMIALVSIASPSTAFSAQVLTRLESTIVSAGKLIVVDRANLDKIRAEQGFNCQEKLMMNQKNLSGNF